MREQAHPGYLLRILWAGKRANNTLIFFQHPKIWRAEPIERSAPIQVTVHVGFKEHQICNLLLIPG